MLNEKWSKDKKIGMSGRIGGLGGDFELKLKR